MSYWTDMKRYAREHIEDVEDQSVGMTISTEDRYDGDVEISLTWMTETDHFDDLEVTDKLPTSRSVRVEQGTVREETQDIFDKLKSSLNTDASIRSVSIRKTDDDHPFNKGEYSVIFGVEDTSQITDIGNALLEHVNQLSEGHGNAEIVEAEAVYDDFEKCSLLNVESSLRVDQPHLFFSNVNSIDDVIDKVDDPETLKDSERYIVPLLVREDGDLDNSIQSDLENRMMEKVTELVDPTYSYDIEGESVFVQRDTKAKEDYNFTYLEDYKPVSIGEQSVYFWIHADVEDIIQFDFDAS